VKRRAPEGERPPLPARFTSRPDLQGCVCPARARWPAPP
jgi:hypothetical protein